MPGRTGGKAWPASTNDEEVVRPVKIRTARTARGDSENIEEWPRRDLGLDDLLDRLWERNRRTRPRR